MTPGEQVRQDAPNGFDGPWNPICPFCQGYMHTGHTAECPVTVGRERRSAELLALLRKAKS